MNLKKIGENIKKLRIHKGLTQSQLAEIADISTVHISHIETGSVAMSLESLIAISNGLGTTPDIILLGEYNLSEDGVNKLFSNASKSLTSDENRLIIEVAKLLSELKVNRR